MFLGILASFFLFTSFILELFVMIGQLSNKLFLNILYFVQANNRQYNLSYGFGLWSYCQGPYAAPVQSCSKNLAAYNWAHTPGFSTMLPSLASSKSVERVFLALFILYFIGLILSFLLWVTTITFCGVHKRVGNRVFDAVMGSLTLLNFLVMFAAMIIAITLVVNSVKAVSGASTYWSGHAGISLWFTIASVVALFLAALCYLLQFCCGSGRRNDDFGMVGGARGGRVNPAYSKPFDLTPHQPVTHTPMLHNATRPQLLEPQHSGIPQLQQQQQQQYQQHPFNNPQPYNTNTTVTPQQQQDPHSISSTSQQYSTNAAPPQ